MNSEDNNRRILLSSLLIVAALCWHTASNSGAMHSSNSDISIPASDDMTGAMEYNFNQSTTVVQHNNNTTQLTESADFINAATDETPSNESFPLSAKRLIKNIPRANFTHGIENHEPVDAIVSISRRYENMYFFTELVGLKGEVIKHQWLHDGRKEAEVEFNVSSPRWRAYSSKKIESDSLGTWTVIVTNSKGLTLAKTSIIVVD